MYRALTYCYPTQQRLEELVVFCEKAEDLAIVRYVDEDREGVFGDGCVVADE
jgi:hypothetical protein